MGFGEPYTERVTAAALIAGLDTASGRAQALKAVVVIDRKADIFVIVSVRLRAGGIRKKKKEEEVEVENSKECRRSESQRNK